MSFTDERIHTWPACSLTRLRKKAASTPTSWGYCLFSRSASSSLSVRGRSPLFWMAFSLPSSAVMAVATYTTPSLSLLLL